MRARLLVPVAAVVLLASLAAYRGLSSSPPADPIDVGPIAWLRDKHVTFVAPANAYVVALPDGGFVALSARSPHLGHQIDYCRASRWFEDRFHGEKFDSYGYYRMGPSPRGMDRVAVEVTRGDVYLFKGRITEGPPRGARRPGPLTEPAGEFCIGAAGGG